MHFEKTKLDGVWSIRPMVFEDFRGEFLETYNETLFHKSGVEVRFVQDDLSISCHRVVRGIHCDSRAWKLITCLHGRMYVVAVNNIPGAAQYRQWEGLILSGDNHRLLLIPPGFGVGFQVLSDKAMLHYKQSEDYDLRRQTTIAWDDPGLNIPWPLKDPILSPRDRNASSPGAPS